jgi:hypothetical protein
MDDYGQAIEVLRRWLRQARTLAAKRQAATAGFARQMLDYLFRARHDETLRFKARAGGGSI